MVITVIIFIIIVWRCNDDDEEEEDNYCKEWTCRCTGAPKSKLNLSDEDRTVLSVWTHSAVADLQ